jgi:hypothetical protein
MSIAGKIETTAHVTTIVAATLIAVVLVRAEFLPVARPTITSPPGAEAVKGKSVDSHALKVDWAKNHRTLIMAISTTFHYCKDSIPFYQRLAGTDVKMVAALPQSVTEAQQYLSGSGVHVDDVKQVPLNTLGVRGTPTLLLVNDAGVVTDVWTGKLQPDQEAQVLAALGKKNTGG